MFGYKQTRKYGNQIEVGDVISIAGTKFQIQHSTRIEYSSTIDLLLVPHGETAFPLDSCITMRVQAHTPLITHDK